MQTNLNTKFTQLSDDLQFTFLKHICFQRKWLNKEWRYVAASEALTAPTEDHQAPFVLEGRFRPILDHTANFEGLEAFPAP